MWTSPSKLIFSILVFTSACSALDLRVLPEFYRPDPFGGVVEADRSAPPPPSKILRMRVARNGYASSHLVIEGIKSSDEYSLDIEFPLPVETYREWFHFNKPDQR